MRSRIALLLAGLVLLPACEMPAATPSGKRPAVTRQTETQDDNKAQGAKDASTVTTPEATATPAPSVPSTLFKGLAQIDAHYVISAGAGNVISAGSGNVISAGSGNVISAGAGNVISAGGGNVISAGSGNVISAGSGNFRLFEVPTLAVGELLPAKGLVVVPVSLLDRRQLGPAVASNADGTFSVSVPKDTLAKHGKNIRLYAAVPGKDEADSRFRYNMIVPATEGALRTLDEDTSALASYYRTIAHSKFAFLFTPERIALAKAARDSGDITKSPMYDPQLDPFTQELLNNFGWKLIDTADQYGVPESRYTEVAERFADIILAFLDLEGVKLDASYYTGRPEYLEGKTNVNTGVQLVLKDIRERGASKLADADFVAAYSLPDFPIKRPADICEIAVRRYMSADGNQYGQIQAFFLALGYSEAEATDRRMLIHAAGISLARTMGIEVLKFQSTTGGADPIEAMMKELGTK